MYFVIVYHDSIPLECFASSTKPLAEEICYDNISAQSWTTLYQKKHIGIKMQK